MSTTPDPVIAFYDTHPIHEAQIMEALRERGLDPGRLTEEELKEHDQDHFGGLDAVDRLASAAGIDAGTHVLDVCSGMGGPARYLAHRHGCRVTGLDLTRSRHDSAVRLTALVKLDHLVDFHCGSASAMPFDDASFDVVIGQEAWAHVPGKPRLIEEAARVVRPGGRIAFTDIMARTTLPEAIAERLSREMTFSEIASLGDYRELLDGAGCEVLEATDLSDEWTKILRRRLAMYRSLGGSTAARFGPARSREWDSAYAFFVGLFAQGVLGGGRIVAHRR